MGELVGTPKAISFLRECLEGVHGGATGIAAWKFATDRAFGPVAQSIDLKEHRIDERRINQLIAILPSMEMQRIADGEDVNVVVAELISKGLIDPQRLLPEGEAEVIEDEGTC